MISVWNMLLYVQAALEVITEAKIMGFLRVECYWYFHCDSHGNFFWYSFLDLVHQKPINVKNVDFLINTLILKAHYVFVIFFPFKYSLFYIIKLIKLKWIIHQQKYSKNKCGSNWPTFIYLDGKISLMVQGLLVCSPHVHVVTGLSLRVQVLYVEV